MNLNSYDNGGASENKGSAGRGNCEFGIAEIVDPLLSQRLSGRSPS